MRHGLVVRHGKFAPLWLSGPLIAGYVYLGFHYGRDIRRVQQIENHRVSKGNYQAAGLRRGVRAGQV